MVCFHWSDDNGYVTDKNLQHYRDIAAGGAGLIIGEATAGNYFNGEDCMKLSWGYGKINRRKAGSGWQMLCTGMTCPFWYNCCMPGFRE